MPTLTSAPVVRSAPASPAGLTRRQRLDRMFSAHWTEMTINRAKWSQLNDAVRPSRARWCATTSPMAPASQGRILNNVAGRSLRTWSSGAMGGLSNPATEWFELTTTDHALDQLSTVKVWLTDVRDRILSVMDRSNFYAEAEVVYADIALFGTASMAIEEDAETTVRCEAQAIGSYAIGHDNKRRVNRFFREWYETASSMAEKFGDKNLSGPVRNALARPEGTDRFLVRHAIYPNDDYSKSGGEVDATRKAWKECYWEPATTADTSDRFLLESGYDTFPLAVPRWGPISPAETYGMDCPGMLALGDILMLQEMERQGLNGLRKTVSPPTVSGPGWKNKQIYSVPGANNVEDGTQGDPTLREMYQIRLDLDRLERKIERVENRIEDAFFVNLMSPLLDRITDEAQQPTAAQSYIARDEQYGLLGPVIERMADDFHDPAIDRIFGIMWRRGEIPPPPEEMAGKPLRVRLRSRMVNAQKSQGVAAIERHFQFLASVATTVPQLAPMLDIADGDEAGRIHAAALGVPPSVTRDVDGTAAVRAARARQQQAAAMTEALPAVAGAAKSLGDTDMTKDSALTRLLGGAANGR